MEYKVKTVKLKYGTYGEISIVTCQSISDVKNFKNIAIMGGVKPGDTIWID